MSTRRWRPRGGPSARRKRTREFYFNLWYLDRTYPAVVDESLQTRSDEEEETTEIAPASSSAGSSPRPSSRSRPKPTAKAKQRFSPIEESDRLERFWTSGDIDVRSLPEFDGRAIFNRACAEYVDEQGPDWEEVQSSLKGCVILDLYKTFLLPKSWVRSRSSSGSIETGDGRVFSTGSVQTHEGQLFITVEAGRLLVDLADSGTPVIACSFIGKRNSDRYIQSLIDSGVASKFPLIIIVHRKLDKGQVAKGFDPVVAIDDSWDVIQSYHQVEIPATHVTCQRQFADCRREILGRIDQYWGGERLPVGSPGRFNFGVPSDNLFQ